MASPIAGVVAGLGLGAFFSRIIMFSVSWVIISLITRIVLSLGVAVAVIIGFDFVFETIRDLITGLGGLGALSADALAILEMSGFLRAFSLILGAFATKISFSFLTRIVPFKVI